MFEDFIGNKNAKDLISINVRAAIKSNSKLPNMLFTGKAGIGKTYFSKLIAEEADSEMFELDGSKLSDTKGQKKLVKALSELFRAYNDGYHKRAILFIDEAHAVSKKVDDMLLRIISEDIIPIEKSNGDIVNHKIESKKTRTNNFFSFIFATNRAAELSVALRSRLKSCTVPFVDYSNEEKTKIAENYLNRNDVYCEVGVYSEISKRSWTARDVESLCDGIINYSCAEDIKNIRVDDCIGYFNLIGVDENGLNPQEREYLEVLKQHEGKASLNVLSCKLGVPIKEITEMIEPKVISLGLVEISSGGREIVGGIEKNPFLVK